MAALLHSMLKKKNKKKVISQKDCFPAHKFVHGFLKIVEKSQNLCLWVI